MSLFFGFFFLSGFCSLLYQVVWLRVAMAAFGVTTPLVSIVLSIFMAGLALGSWAGGRLVKSFEHRPAGFFVSLYGVIELVVGISGLAVAPLLRAGRTFLSTQGASWGSASYYLASAAWVGLVMLPFCTCMGATFPLAMAGIRAAFRAKSGTSFSYLYLANVLGAMVGTIGSAFLFIEILGFSKTLLIAAALNAVIAAAAFALGFAWRELPGDNEPETNATSDWNLPSSAVKDFGPAGLIALPLLFTSGLASLGMEVIWTRQFTPLLGPVVYSFAGMLAVYLAGTAAGSRGYRIWIQNKGGISEVFASGVAAILAGACAFLPLLVTDPRLLPYSYLNRMPLIVVGIAPFCAVAGFMTPMLVDWWSQGDPDRAGKAYAVNAVGCILGPLLAGFVLLPAAGERWSLLLLALPFFGFGVWSLTAGADAGKGASRPALGGLLAAALATSVLLVTLTDDFETFFPGARVKRDYTATSVAAGKGMERRLLVNGVGMTALSPITKMMAHLPMASLPAPPRSVLVLCFGMGTSFRSALSWDVPVTVVELVPSVPTLFSYFHEDGDQLMRSPNAESDHRRRPALPGAHAGIVRRDHRGSAASGGCGRLQPPLFHGVLSGSTQPSSSRRYFATVATGASRGRHYRDIRVRPIPAAQFWRCARVQFDGTGMGLPFSGERVTYEQVFSGHARSAFATGGGARFDGVGTRFERRESVRIRPGQGAPNPRSDPGGLFGAPAHRRPTRQRVLPFAANITTLESRRVWLSRQPIEVISNVSAIAHTGLC